MIEKLVRKNIRKLMPYKVNIYDDVVKLDANENNDLAHGFNEEIAEALLDLKINEYPDSDCWALRRQLADKLSLLPEELIIGAGSDQIISMIINAFVDPGDNILTFSPTFSMYRIGTELVGGNTYEYELDSQFKLDYDGFIKKVEEDKWKIIFLTNPNNPTGGIIPRHEIIRILDIANAIVVVDEAYYEFYGETVIDLIRKYPNLIVLRTLSKAYALAGARVGYGAGSKELLDILYRVKPPYNVTNLSQVAAKICLENQDMMMESVKKIILEREAMEKELGSIEGIKVYESHANFLLCRIERAKDLYEYLLERGVLIRCFGDQGPLANCIRITIGIADENQLVLGIIKEFMGIK
ncbi:MAG: histidinol-phosphate transaminase [Clostridiales bacterium]|nr:histidinol-phosphate transaminase [Clostridiales bacterium]